MVDARIWAASWLLLGWKLWLGAYSVGFFFFYSSQLCCLLRFQNSPQTCRWEGFLVFGNFSSFKTPFPGWSPSLTLLSLFLSFIFCPTFFWREWAAFLRAWCPLPVFRSCFMEVAQHSNDLLIFWICGGESGLPVLFLCHLRTFPTHVLNFLSSQHLYEINSVCIICSLSYLLSP